MRKIRSVFSKGLSIIGFSVLAFVWATQSHAVLIAQDDPANMVRDLSNQLVAAMNEQRAELEASPEKVKEFAGIYVLPYIDTARMARYVMGKHWRTATEAQQEKFVAAFSNTLIRSYSQSLLKFQVKTVTVRSAQEEKPGRVTVPSTIVQADGNETNVSYRAFLDEKSQKWMLYDVSIEGISMLLNYRKAYDSEFSKVGIDTTIADMEAKNSDFNS